MPLCVTLTLPPLQASIVFSCLHSATTTCCSNISGLINKLINQRVLEEPVWEEIVRKNQLFVGRQKTNITYIIWLLKLKQVPNKRMKNEHLELDSIEAHLSLLGEN